MKYKNPNKIPIIVKIYVANGKAVRLYISTSKNSILLDPLIFSFIIKSLSSKYVHTSLLL